MPARKAGQGVNRRERKAEYITKLNSYLQDYKSILVVNIDNVGSNQIQQIRKALRGKAVVLMGKNTIVRKILRELSATNPGFESLLPLVFGNIGFVFTNENLSDIRTLIQTNKKPAAARVGIVAPNDVWIPGGSTGLDPGQTAFFQVLNIATKIVKGSIEIINDVHLIKKGDKVNTSHVALLDKLNIRPFHFAMTVTHVYDNGTVYSAAILDMSQEDLMQKFMDGVRKVAAVSLAISYPTEAALPYLFSGAFSKLVALSLVTDYSFDAAEKFKNILANPGAFAAAAPAAAAPVAAAAAAPEVKEESEEEEMGFDLFD